jgi:hypothetical protein
MSKKHLALWLTVVCLCATTALAPSFRPAISSGAASQSQPPVLAIEGRVVAVGIPDAGAIAAVGFFHPGGSLRSEPAFAELTRRGRVLDPARILVASNSNFGAPDAAEGAVLSLDPDGETIVVPLDFAASDGQASTSHGRVQLFTARSSRFLNIANSANAPRGLGAAGRVLTAAQDRMRFSESAGQLPDGTVAVALLGASPDDRKKAALAILMTDGSIAQMREAGAAEELAPPGTLSPIPLTASPRHTAGPLRVARAGMIASWFPDRIIYTADPGRNAVIALSLVTQADGFRLSMSRTFSLPELDVPVDLAPAAPEVADPNYSSNTSLAPGSDIYAASRGNGTIVRMRQDGTVIAVRRVTLPGGRNLGPARLNGIAVSPEGRRIWLTVDGPLPGHPDAPGAVLEIPAFGQGPPNARGRAPGANLRPRQMAARGARLFSTSFTPAQGLGPLYNARSCTECHRSPRPGGAGPAGFAPVQRIGRRDNGSFDPLAGHGGPIARTHTIAELGIQCSLTAGPSPLANVVSTRNTPPLFGLGLIETIPHDMIRAGAARHGPSAGRPNIVRDAQGAGRAGRFGWKADTASLEQFVAEAFRNELGMTNPLAPGDLVPAQADCGSKASPAIEMDGAAVRAVAAFIASLPAPLPAVEKQDPIGRILFSATGCAACHTPVLLGAAGEVPLYSDLLLHGMGPGLDDGVVQGEARGEDWRTTPLWGLSMRRRFLHDGRARSVEDAILAHDGEGRQAAAAFGRLTRPEQDALLTFLLGL